jgi:UDPglucose 6-dehydrogenase
LRIAMIGVGHVGPKSASGFSDFGDTRVCFDRDERIALSIEDVMPIREPGLDALVKRNSGEQGRTYSSDLASALADIEAALIGRMAIGLETGASDAD